MASISNDDNNNNNGNTITIQLTVTSAQGAPRVPVTIDTSISAQELRATAAKVTQIPLDTLKLIFRGRLIGGAPGDDGSNVAAVTEFKLEDGSVVHCMGKPVPTAAATTNSSTTSATGGTTQLLPTVSVSSSSSTTTTTVATPAVPTADPLTVALQTLRTANPPDVYQTAITTLSKILQNITTHPLEAKYRSLKVDNAAFQRRLGGVAGGDAAIRACGFQVEEQEEAEGGTTCRKYVLQANPQAWPAVQQAARTVQAAAALASAASNSNSGSGVSSLLPNPNNNNNNMGAMGAGVWPNLMPPGGMMGAGGAGLGAGGLPPGMLDSPEMQQVAAQMMSNPQALQAMVQDPMMQSMIRNDPRFANNPQAQQLFQELGNNPQMAQMMSQLISNPQARAQLLALEQQQYGGAPPPDPARMAQLLQGMMATNGGGGNAGGSMNPPLPSTSGTRSSGANNSSSTSGNTDEDLTEEEMIAEAIRRSLQDGSNGGGGGGF